MNDIFAQMRHARMLRFVPAQTMPGLLPPSSNVTGVRCLAACSCQKLVREDLRRAALFK